MEMKKIDERQDKLLESQSELLVQCPEMVNAADRNDDMWPS